MEVQVQMWYLDCSLEHTNPIDVPCRLDTCPIGHGKQFHISTIQIPLDLFFDHSPKVPEGTIWPTIKDHFKCTCLQSCSLRSGSILLANGLKKLWPINSSSGAEEDLPVHMQIKNNPWKILITFVIYPPCLYNPTRNDYTLSAADTISIVPIRRYRFLYETFVNFIYDEKEYTLIRGDDCILLKHTNRFKKHEHLQIISYRTPWRLVWLKRKQSSFQLSSRSKTHQEQIPELHQRCDQRNQKPQHRATG